MRVELNLFAILLMILVPVIPASFWIRAILRIRYGTAGLVSLASNVLVAAGLGVFVSSTPDGVVGAGISPVWARLHSDNAPLFVLCAMVAGNMVIALTIKLYLALFTDNLSPEEQTPGIVGFRAWGSPAKVLAVVTMAACLYFVLDYDYVGVTLMGLAALFAYPLFNTLGRQSAAEGSAADPMAPLKAPADERQRVLALVESGKITAEDAAELLTALAQSQAVDVGASKPLSGARRVMLAGAGVILVGFFLPWFSINLQAAAEMAAGMAQNTQQSMANALPGVTINGSVNSNPEVTNPFPNVPVPANNAVQWSVRGGDVQHGLGWLILAAGLATACMPFFWTPASGQAQQLRNVSLILLAAGSVLAIYVLSGSFNAATSIEPGFVIVLLGYAASWFGFIREHLAMPVVMRPAVAV